MRAPSLLSLDEGRRGRSDTPTPEDRLARRGSGRSTYARGDWQHGRPVERPGRPGTGPFGGWARQASEGPIVCAGQRSAQVGWSPTGARMEGAISEGEGTASLASAAAAEEGRVSTARWNPK